MAASAIGWGISRVRVGKGMCVGGVVVVVAAGSVVLLRREGFVAGVSSFGRIFGSVARADSGSVRVGTDRSWQRRSTLSIRMTSHSRSR